MECINRQLLPQIICATLGKVMKKKSLPKLRPATLVSIGIVAVIVSALVFVSTLPRSTSTPPVQTTPQSTAQPSESTPLAKSVPAEAPKRGYYLPYTEDALSKTLDRKLLFFHASWCPQCRALEKDIKAHEIPAGLTIFKVNYDKAGDLRKTYGVTLQTTLVEVNNAGKLVKKYVAYDTPTLAAVLKAFGY